MGILSGDIKLDFLFQFSLGRLVTRRLESEDALLEILNSEDTNSPIDMIPDPPSSRGFIWRVFAPQGDGIL